VKRRKKTKAVWMLPLVGAALGGLAVYLWQLTPETRPPELPDTPIVIPAPKTAAKAPQTKLIPATSGAIRLPAAQPSPASQTPAPTANPALATVPLPPPKTTPPAAAPAPAPVATKPEEVLAAQIQLNRLGISSGAIDGRMGSQTASALRFFQRSRGLPETGLLDAGTKLQLNLGGATLANYAVTAQDLAGLRPLGETWLAKSQQDRLAHETLLELVAEKSCAHPNLIQRLNPGRDWTMVMPGETVIVPAAALPATATRAARVQISLSQRTLEAFDAENRLLAHFPCSIGRIAEKRPVGELRVINVAPNPDYTFDPAVFPESPEARNFRSKLHLSPGPNNPVGTAWIGLDRPGFGIHGTPNPEQVGRTESHGCFRLANWNAGFLLRMVWIGLPITVEP
jgi:lipoprotein-anchoring transpeptidase ErfK/SrfK